MRRSARGPGIPVDPARVKEARIAAGLSLGQVAGNELSRTFIHFIEQGKARPSKTTLALIARRTGKPISYFLAAGTDEPQPYGDLAVQIAEVAAKLRRISARGQLTAFEREAMKLLELTFHQGAAMTRALEMRVQGERPS
jgi:transcriptional regulator with XRE-family HTH domain